ncbi:DUF3618 domain-containing protein [Janibacter indicus]|uniref:DUF3618 domain-containing protein n=1 Tax=Janibacter indicus TaxID=857417 RepID=A0A7L9IYP1_9MICO|nr:DUF3618 domain-containing protein [Janibacter indicus]QOK22398.1 DUF3618 domain-containing protein [Janibacter indicus]
MSSNDPDQIRAEIDRTRSDLSTNVDALGEAVTPGNIARRQADKVKGGMTGLKDKVMGVDDPTSPTLAERGSDHANEARRQVKSKTRGNPLAAGLVAVGAGWLLGSLLPASEKEKQAAVTAKEQAAPVLDEAKSMAQQGAEHLKEPAQEAAQSLKESAQDAAETVKAQGQQQAETVGTSAAESREAVQQHQQRPDTNV